LPISHNGPREDAAAVEIVAECRRAVGPDLVLMVDVAYAWPDAATALGVIERLAPYRIAFIETPIDIDDLEGYAFLHARSPIPAGPPQRHRRLADTRPVCHEGPIRRSPSGRDQRPDVRPEGQGGVRSARCRGVRPGGGLTWTVGRAAGAHRS
jgi:hypothetical protein